ncbi:MAG TPA: CDP-glycerol glycerophosphotransferase family protein [Thermoleophilaceae bacterium]|nr:CDP-glycerol glycerophosphotransferase family protein [Thermoleophilaceae bacterium]
MGLLARVPGLRQVPQVLGPVLDDVILFESWRGQYSDNPRAISEELHGRGTHHRHVWVIDPALAPGVPDWVETVTPGSRGHLAMMGRAGHLVTNTTVLGFHHKRPGTRLMQTWHGTPLKRIGFGIPRDGSRAARQAVDTLRHNVKRWDLLLSPNRFSTPIFREAFEYEGPIEETGYPRNDLLVGPHGDAVRERTRSALGIAPGQRVVLYAPTFRDSVQFALEPQVDRLAQELGESHVVLLRTHKVDAGVARTGRFVDVSAYPDNRELYLAADVLVTDYSSVMFDFAVTGKPMVFFTYDLADYRDRARGFYFDLEAEAPGPLVATAEELAEAVAGADADAPRLREAYQCFAERFCHLEDGRASARVVNLLLAG